MNQKITRIRDYQKKARERDKDSVFVMEGIRSCREVSPERTVMTVVSESFALKEEVPENSIIIKDADFLKISDTKTPQGILKVVKRTDCSEDEIISEENGLILLLENLQDPGNLGTILRTAEACGVSGIIMNDTTVDVYNPKVVRSSMGSILRVRFSVTKDLKKTVEKIRNSGGCVYAAHLKDSESYTKRDYTGKTAFLIGNEGNGLTDEITEAADACIHIPMQGKVESLNAAIAATVLIFEAARQREKGGN